MSGWRATIPTERLFGDPRFLRLDEPAQSLLLRLYARCDRWGRGPAHPRVLPLHLMLVRADARAQLDELAGSGLVQVYSVGGDDYYQIADYDADALRDTLRKRGASNYPAPQGQTETALGADQGQTETALGADQGQTETALGADQGQTETALGADSGRPRSAHTHGSRAEQSRAEQSVSPARADGPAPTRAIGAPWPSQECRARAEQWLSALEQHGPVGGPPPIVTHDAMADLAREFGPEAFVAACDTTVTMGKAWRGWRVRNPLSWLKSEADNARSKAAAQAARRPKRPPSYADTPPPTRVPSYADLEAQRGGA